MKTKARLLCSFLFLALTVMLPVTARAESAVLSYERANKLFGQIQDLELMQRNIEECYQAEQRPPTGAPSSGLSWRDHAELDGKLMTRVLSYLAGFPEYERFITEYRTLVQSSEYRRLHTDKLFIAYERLLESGRIRLLAQLKERQESVAEESSVQAHEWLAQSIPSQTVMFGHTEGSQRAESWRAVPAVRVQIQMPVNGLVKELQQGTGTRLTFSDAIQKGVGACRQ